MGLPFFRLDACQIVGEASGVELERQLVKLDHNARRNRIQKKGPPRAVVPPKRRKPVLESSSPGFLMEEALAYNNQQ